MLSRFRRDSARSLALSLILLGFLAYVALPAGSALAQADDPTIKIGLTYNSASGGNYTLEETGSGTEASNSDPIVGTGLFAEWIVLGRIGLELSSTVLPLERTYDLESGGTTISSVTEQVTFLTYGANLYFNRRLNRGLQYFAGLGAGTMGVSQDFKNGTLGDQSSSVTIPLTWLKGGVDWLIKGGGGRLQFVSFTGSAVDTDSISGYKQNYEYNLGVISLGVFVFF